MKDTLANIIILMTLAAFTAALTYFFILYPEGIIACSCLAAFFWALHHKANQS